MKTDPKLIHTGEKGWAYAAELARRYPPLLPALVEAVRRIHMSESNRTSTCGRVGGPLAHCGTCGKRKQPYGRFVPAAMAGVHCNHNCPGYYVPQRPDSLFPGEVCKGSCDCALRGMTP